MSFTAITGIPCAGDSVPLAAGLHPMTADRVAYIQTLLGMVLEMKGTYSLKFDSIQAHYTRERVAAATRDRSGGSVFPALPIGDHFICRCHQLPRLSLCDASQGFRPRFFI